MSFDLSNKKISKTFQDLLQIRGDDSKLYNLTGNEVGNIRISGSLIANEYIVSSSVTNVTFLQQSGSTIFGDSRDDTHLFIGATISGSSYSTGSFGKVLVNKHSIISDPNALIISDDNNRIIAEFKSDSNVKPAGVNIGIGSETKGSRAVAIATGSVASGSNSIVIGVDALTKDEAVSSVAIGDGAQVWGYKSITIGSNSKVHGSFPSSSVVIGTLSTGSADYTIAIGYNVHSANTASVAIGKGTITGGERSIALGIASASANDSMALGSYSTGSAVQSTAIGYRSRATGNSSIGIGYLYGTGTYPKGGATNTAATAIGVFTHATGIGSVGIGYYNSASGDYSTALGGYYSVATGEYAVSMGNRMTVSGTGSFGINLNTVTRTVSQDNTMAIMGGNVGIGTTSPQYKLDVQGDIRATGDLIAENFIVSSSVTYMTQSFSSGSTIFGDTPADDTHQFTGSVSISGSTALHVNGDVRIEDDHKLFFGDTATGEYIYRNSNDLKLYSGDDILINAGDDIVHRGNTHGFEDTSAARVMTVDAANAKVGIGTTSPDAVLHITGSATGNITANINRDFTTTANDGSGQLVVGGTITAGTNDNVSGILVDTDFDRAGSGTYTAAGLRVNAPSISNSGGTVTGAALYIVSASTGANSNYSLMIDDGNVSLGSGNVGIGTTSPSQPLHIVTSGNGGLELDNSTGAPSIIFDIPSNEQARLYFQEDDTVLGSIIYETSGTPDAIVFKAGSNAERMRITDTGYVGIGTSSPAQALEVVGTIEISGVSTPTINLNDSNGSTWQLISGAPSNTYFCIQNASNSDIRPLVLRHDGTVEFGLANQKVSGSLTSTGSFGHGYFDGNVGIGTTSPEEKLHVVGSVWIDDNGTKDGLIINPGAGSSKTTIQALENGSSTQPLELQATSFDFWGQSKQILYLDAVNQKVSGSLTSTGSFGSLVVADKVQGQLKLDGSSGNEFYIGSSYFMDHTSNDYLKLRIVNGYDFIIHNDSGDIARFALTDAGNVGIGTITPRTLLEVTGSTTFGNIPTTHTHDFTGSLLITGSRIDLDDGKNNVSIGKSAGAGITTGTGNTIIGSLAGDTMDTNTDNTLIGHSAGGATSANANKLVAIGRQALVEDLTTDADGTIAIGYQAGMNIKSGRYNTAIGYEAFKTATELDQNTAIGYQALKVASGSAGTGNNTAVGYNAGVAMTTGDQNTLLGSLAGDTLTVGKGNTFLGYGAGDATTSINYGVVIGYNAMGSGNATSDAHSTIAIGMQALNSITSGQYNIGIGRSTLESETTGDGSIAIGYEAANTQAGTDGDVGNTAIGFRSLLRINKGKQTTAVGFKSGYYATGSYNTFIGTLAGEGATTSAPYSSGQYNTALGYGALRNFTSGNYNIAIGLQAGDAISSGANNVVIGANAGGAVTDANNNTLVGDETGKSITTGAANVALGRRAIKTATTAAANVSIGAGTLEDVPAGEALSGVVAVGFEAFKGSSSTTDDANYTVAIGYEAGKAITTGANNVLMGYQAGDAITSGPQNTIVGSLSGTALTIGSHNTSLGTKALYSAVEDSYNVAVGYEALRNANGGGSDGTATATNNTAIGWKSGDVITTGTSNTLIGSDTDPSAADGANQIVIGVGITGGEDNQFTFGKASNVVQNEFDTDANWTRTSDARKKRDIKDDTLGLDFINDLRTVTHKWKPSNEFPKEWDEYSEENNMNLDATMHGMIAQEVKSALDKAGVDTFSGWKERPDGSQTVSREMFVMPLIKAVQELSEQVKEQKKEIEELKNKI